MQSDIHQLDDNGAKEAAKSSELATTLLSPNHSAKGRHGGRSPGIRTKNNLRYKHMFRTLATVVLICTFLHLAPSANTAPDEGQNSAQSVNAVIEWNRTLLVIVRTPGGEPATIHSTRNFAILHAAIFDACNTIEPRFRP